MATSIRNQEGFSASVRLELRARGSVYDVAQVGDGALILRTPSNVPPGPAELVVYVSGVPDIRQIVISARSASDDPEEIFFW